MSVDDDTFDALCCEANGFNNDEKTMLDLHLGNAINLDVVEYFLRGSFDKYNIFIAHFHRRLWDQILPFRNDVDEVSIGLLECTQRVLLKKSKKAKMTQKLFRTLTKVVAGGLKKRDIMIPIVQYEDQIADADIHVNGLNLELFRFILKAVCMTSEAWREGSSIVYSGFTIDRETIHGTFRYGGVVWDLQCNNQFVTVYDRETSKEYVGNFDSLLMLMDTLGQRLCLEIGIIISSAAEVEGTPTLEDAMSLINAGDHVLEEYGNNGYEFIALFESMVVSILLKKNPDQITENTLFFDNCRNELSEMIEEGLFDNKILSYFDIITDFLLTLSNDVLSNLFCIYRIWGHPRVDIKEGMSKVMKKGTAIKIPTDEIPDIICNQFKKIFVTSYYDQHHKYPRLSFIGDKKTYISDCIEAGAPISSHHQNYSFSDWGLIELKQMWTVPTTYDVCHILNDKAVSPNRSELYDSIKNGNGTFLGVQRRGLVRWLKGKSIKCKKFLAMINAKGIDIDSLIIGMYEKEREIKIKARMFSLMSEIMRMYFVLTEELIAEHILKYFPQITMKDPLHVQIKKLWAISGSSNSTSIDPVINIDFEKWNLNFRKELTDPIFKAMDGLFGYDNLISRTHDIFYNSYIYSSSGKYCPKISSSGLCIDPPMAYTKHIGGFEGLRQKGWTVTTVCLLCYIADMSRISMNLLGQGDNQVVRLYMPHNYWNNLSLTEEQKVVAAKEKLKLFMRDMDSHFREAGLPIKIRETWTSTRLCMYGKNMFLDAKCMPQWVKKLLRTYALSNEGTLTISGVIGTLATNMNAAAHASSSPDIMYVIFLLLAEWSLEFLFAYHPFTRKQILDGDEIIINMPSSKGFKKVSSGYINLERLAVTILMIPTSVGGSITIPLTSFIMRGFPDHGSEGYSWLKLLASVDSPWKGMFNNWYSFVPNETIEFDMLVQSPWSLNHRKPPTPGLQSREVVRDWLMSGEFQSNTFIKNIKTIMSGFDRKKVCSLFCTEEINPLILNELYCTFPQVYLDSVLRRIEQTRTIRKLAMEVSNRNPIVSKLMDLEYEFIGYLYWRGNKKGKKYSNCATEQCRQSRNKGWGRIIKGLTTPHPLEYAFDHQCTSVFPRCNGSDYIYVRIDQDGSFPPYLGSNVRTKVLSMQDPTARTEPLVSTSSKLAKLAPWLKLGPNTRKLISDNVSIVCDTTIFDNFFDDDHTFFSGSVEHRYNPACSSEGCFINYSPQLGSKVFMSTDNMPRYGKGQQNVTMNFQALFCMLQYCSARREDTTCIHYHLCCEDCIKEVDDHLTDISDFGDEMKKIYTDAVLADLKDTLGFLSENYSKELEPIQEGESFLHLIQPTQVDPNELGEGVTWLLGVRAAKMIMCANDNTSSSIRQEDLQSFPRVYSYKVSSAKVLKYCVAACLAIKMHRMYNRTDDYDFDNVKMKLKTQLVKTTLDKYKGIASLCVGRTYDPEENENPVYFNTGEFPETVLGFTTSIRSEIVSFLDSLTGFESISRNWIVPVAGVTLSDQVMLLRIRLLSKEFCPDCLKSLSIISSDRSQQIDCGQGHLKKEMKKCKGYLMPLDAVIKNFRLQSTQKVPSLVIRGSGLASMLCWNYPYLPKSTSLEVKMDRDGSLRTLLTDKESVILPTRAAYKWDIMLSMIQEKDYNNIVVLGDGVGFTSAVCARRFPSASVYPSGLLENGKMIPQDLQSMKPFVSRVYTNVKGRFIENVADNITNSKWNAEFKIFLLGLSGRTLVISDIEGRGTLEKILSSMIADLDGDESLDFIFKVYYKTFVCSVPLYQYSNWMCNLIYQEGFVSNLCLPVGRVLPKESVEEGMNIKNAPLPMISNWIDIFHESYQELLEVSIKIALNALHRNLLPVEVKELSFPPEVVLVRFLTYISANFKAPYTGVPSGDNRKLFDGVLFKLIKGAKMIFLILYGEKIKRKSFFKNLGISRVEKGSRVKELSNFQMIFVDWEGEREIVLNTKEERAAQVLRTVYLRNVTNLHDRRMPNDLTELYTELIIPGNIFWNRAKHFVK